VQLAACLFTRICEEAGATALQLATWTHWHDSYCRFLEDSEMFVERAVYVADVKKVRNLARTAGRAGAVPRLPSAGLCTGETHAPVASGHGFALKPLSCSVCELPVAVLSDHQCSTAEPAPHEMCLAWCTGCLHGGHLKHLQLWFAKHRVCPVAGCKCQCRM
jgi:hypothetical protein